MMGIAKSKLLARDQIKEDIYLLPISNVDYISKSGNVYKEVEPGIFFQRKNTLNKACGYIYTRIKLKNGRDVQRRLHILLAKMFINNPKPDEYKMVGHLDNDKTNYSLDNLYWTNCSENTQKAVDEGIFVNKKAEYNSQSFPIRVVSAITGEVVGVYGSISECNRCISNISKTFISKQIKKENYNPRNKRYIYSRITLDEFYSYPEIIRNVHLEDNVKTNRQPKVFRMTNSKLNYDKILDNQKQAEKITGIKQSMISKYIKENNGADHGGWVFEYIGDRHYCNSSAYSKMVYGLSKYAVEDINTGEKIDFNTLQDLKTYTGYKGHGIKDYITNKHILMNKWRVIKVV